MQLELLYPQIFEKLEKIDEKQDLAQDEARDFRNKIAPLRL